MIALLSIPVDAAEKFIYERALMGTRFGVTCYAADGAAAERAAEIAFGIAEELDAIASDYLADSELSLLSGRPVGTAIEISPLLYELLDHSRRVAEATRGAFDPTIGPLTKLWRASREGARLPDPDELRAASGAVGWEYFTLDLNTRTLTLLRENMAFDLGGVAKGYAVDLMLESFVGAGIPQVLIAAGGDIRLGDPPPGRDGWRVALQTFDPVAVDRVLVLSNVAVSTSGDLYQSVEIEGIRYSHVLDPLTGLGLTRRLAASVIADEAKFSDPIATAACVLGADSREALRELDGVREVIMRVWEGPVALEP